MPGSRRQRRYPPPNRVVQVRSAVQRSGCAADVLFRRDSSPQRGYQTEGNGEANGKAEKQPVNTTSRLEDGASATKDTTQPGATRLEQNRDGKGDAQNNLDDLNNG